MSSFGFIILRHVNSEKTNKYWNHSIKNIRTNYPLVKIVIIDDNSNYDFVKSEFDYKNIEVIKSEFHKRGELLPYVYYLKYKWFDYAFIFHDSVFLHKRINIGKIIAMNINVLPLWHFEPDKENVNNTIRISNYLRNNSDIQQSLLMNKVVLGLDFSKWYGCFGGQCFIKYDFLKYIENKYKLTNLIQPIKCRKDRSCFERIIGTIFFSEDKNMYKIKSLFGSIFTDQNWGYNYDDYEKDFNNKNIKKKIVKVWTGR